MPEFKTTKIKVSLAILESRLIESSRNKKLLSSSINVMTSKRSKKVMLHNVDVDNESNSILSDSQASM